MQPAWVEFADKSKGSQVKVGEVDCDAQPQLRSAFSVRGYPTLLLIKDGQVYQYNKARNIESFTNFVESGWKDAQSSPLPNLPSRDEL